MRITKINILFISSFIVVALFLSLLFVKPYLLQWEIEKMLQDKGVVTTITSFKSPMLWNQFETSGAFYNNNFKIRFEKADIQYQISSIFSPKKRLDAINIDEIDADLYRFDSSWSLERLPFIKEIYVKSINISFHPLTGSSVLAQIKDLKLKRFDVLENRFFFEDFSCTLSQKDFQVNVKSPDANQLYFSTNVFLVSWLEQFDIPLVTLFKSGKIQINGVLQVEHEKKTIHFVITVKLNDCKFKSKEEMAMLQRVLLFAVKDEFKNEEKQAIEKTIEFEVPLQEDNGLSFEEYFKVYFSVLTKELIKIFIK